MNDDIIYMNEDSFKEFKNKTPSVKREVREVCEYDIDGVYLNTYKDIKEAHLATGIAVTAIYRCCKGDTRKLLGEKPRIFLYRGNDIEDRMSLIESTEKKSKFKYPMIIEEYTLKGGFLREFPSIAQASKASNIRAKEIGKCLRGKTSLYIGERIFLKKGESIKHRLKEIRDEKRKKDYQSKPGRLVNMYDLNGKILKLYPSISSAARDNKVSLWTVFDCCKGEKDGRPRLSVEDKIFLYDGESIKLRLKEIEKLNKEL